MDRKTGLVIVDVQNDFCPGGALPVPGGDQAVPVLNRYIEIFTDSGLPVFATRDWHPAITAHFSEFGGKWPEHCVQDTHGASFHHELALPKDAIIITKGDRPDEDGYSGFQGRDENGRYLADILKAAGIDHIYVGGLATDYCVKNTVLDALERGLRVTLLADAVRGVEIKEGDSQAAIDEMIDKGADTVLFEEVEIKMLMSI